MRIIEKIKRLFMSKKKKLILDIKKKHKKNITDEDINDYRRKNKLYPDSTSDVDILGLILLEDIVKSTHSINTESQTNRSDSWLSSCVSGSISLPKSSKTSKTSKTDDSYTSSSYSSYDSGSYSSSDSCSSSSSSSD